MFVTSLSAKVDLCCVLFTHHPLLWFPSRKSPLPITTSIHLAQVGFTPVLSIILFPGHIYWFKDGHLTESELERHNEAFTETFGQEIHAYPMNLNKGEDEAGAVGSHLATRRRELVWGVNQHSEGSQVMLREKQGWLYHLSSLAKPYLKVVLPLDFAVLWANNFLFI